MRSAAASADRGGWMGYVPFGIYFGIVLAKGEVISWFRIQEMFRFQGFHMYGVIGSAVVVGALSLAVLRRAGGDDRPYRIPDKPRTPVYARYWGGGICFGLGWGLLGACPGPIYTLIGGGVTVAVVALVAALGGTFAYAALERVLPH